MHSVAGRRIRPYNIPSEGLNLFFIIHEMLFSNAQYIYLKPPVLPHCFRNGSFHSGWRRYVLYAGVLSCIKNDQYIYEHPTVPYVLASYFWSICHFSNPTSVTIQRQQFPHGLSLSWKSKADGPSFNLGLLRFDPITVHILSEPPLFEVLDGQLLGTGSNCRPGCSLI